MNFNNKKGINAAYAYQYNQPQNQDLQDADDYYDEEDEMEMMVPPGFNQMVAGNAQMMDPISLRAEQLQQQGFEIMEEELDEDYEPTIEEIEEYARYLGMDMVEDRDLFYIAKEGLKAPLPDPWKPCKSPRGNIYYFNFETQGMQKDHPCDDYYKKYYQNEKGNKRKKKEEKIIKQQIKQQQKQIMSNSMGSTGPNINTQSANNPNSSLQQMILMNMSGIDGSTSVVNERVQYELEQLLDDHEEKKIQHERAKREELKKIEAENKAQKQKIMDNAKKEAEDLKKKMARSQSSDKDIKIQQRKTQLQLEKDKKIHEIKEQERQKAQKSEKQFATRFDKKKDDFKKEEEQRHKLEQDNIKNKYSSKLKIEREKIQDENNRLLEESGDIDFQIRLFKADLMESQAEQQKYQLEEENRQRLQELKKDNKSKLEKERQRIQADFEAKLEKEKEKENRKLKIEKARIEDKKEDLKKEFQNTLRDEKRKLEKQMNERQRQKKIEIEDEIERNKADTKKQVASVFEMREDRIEKEFQKYREDIKREQDKYEQQQRSKFESQKDSIERTFQEEFEEEKQDYLKQENEKSETYQQIMKEITQGKYKLKDLQSKLSQLQRDKKNMAKECDELEIEKRGKERQLKSNQNLDNKKDIDLKERQLERELKDLEEELDRLKSMIRDKKISNESKQRFGGVGRRANGNHNEDDDENYHRLTKELDSIKLMIINLQHNQPAHSNPKHHSQNPHRIKFKKPNVYDYHISEIEAYIELHLPKIKHKREKFENDRIILKQLIANIERNRMKIRKDLLEGDTGSELSHSRKLAIASVKDKIDEQALILEKEEDKIRDKCDYYRRKEDKLRVIRQKIQLLSGQDRFEDDLDENKKDAILKEIQIDYDKYLKLYQKDDKSNENQKYSLKSRSNVRNQDMIVFNNKWSDYLTDEAYDLKPIISLDPQRQLLKPYSLYQKYEMSDSAYKNKVSTFHIYDKEQERMKQQRNSMKGFLDNQQKWLSNLRQEVNYMKSGHARTLINVGSNETLLHLKNNLSNVLDYY